MIIDYAIKHDYVVKNENFDLKMYIILFVVFSIGIILGSAYFRLIIMNNVDEYNELIETIQIENSDEINEVIYNLIVKHSKNIILYWILGVAVVGSPFLILLCLYRGISNSIIISLIISKLGFLLGNKFYFKYMMLSNIFEIFALIFITMSSIKTSINILKNKKDIKFEITRHTFYTIITASILLLSSIFEIFVRK